MKLLCVLGLHRWAFDNEMWGARFCERCDHRQILIYTAEAGAVWEQKK
jgi:hypothetical protein